MTQQQDDPKTTAIFGVLRKLEGVDDTLLKRPEVKHLPQVLEDEELPGAIVSSTANAILVATDRRVVHIERSWRNDSISRVNSYAYETIETFRADMGFMAPGLSMMTSGGVKALVADKKGRQHFANYVRARLGMEPQTLSSSARSSRKAPWFVGTVVIVVATVAIALEFGSGGDETPTLAPTAPARTVVPTPRATPIPISAQEYKSTTIILFNELLSMVEDGVVSPLVPDLGFAPGNPRARRWLDNVELLRFRGESLEVVDRCFRLSDAAGDVVCGGDLISFVYIMVGDDWDWYLELADKFLELSIQE